MDRRRFIECVVFAVAAMQSLALSWMSTIRGSAEPKALPVPVPDGKCCQSVGPPKLVEVKFVKSVEYFEPRMIDGVLEGPILQVNYGMLLLPEGCVLPDPTEPGQPHDGNAL